MSDMRFTKRTAPDAYDDLVDASRGAGHDSRSDDPLAELARLIDEDPFADFNQRRREPIAGDRYGRTDRPSDEQPVEAEPDHAVPAPAFDDRVEPEPAALEGYAEETDYDRESTERLYADLAAAGQRVEPGFDRSDRSPDPVPEPEAGTWQDSGIDYAAELEATLSAELGRAGTAAASAREPQFDRGDDPEAASPRTAAYDEPAYSETDPAYDETGHILPYDDPSYDGPPYGGEAPVEGSGRRKGAFVVAAMVGLLLLGGAGAFAYRGLFGEDEGGPPPVIRADKSPAKVQPDANADAQDAPQQGKLVYDRVGAEDSADQTRLVPREEPVANVDGRQVRVIDPNDEDNGGLRGAAEDPGEVLNADGLPKRVRTVVVKPDGTIVGEIEKPQAPEPLQPAPLQPAPLPTAGTTTASVTPAAEASASEAAALPETGSVADPQTVSADAAPAESGGIPLPLPRPAELASLQQSAPASAPSTAPASRTTGNQAGENFVPPAAPAPAPASPRAGQPLQLQPNAVASLPASSQSAAASAPARSQQPAAQQATAPAPAAAQPAATAFPPGSFVVQVAATRSEQDARGTASSINQRYASSLSGYTPQVERADLGDRGIYYRVGVGPIRSQGDANSLCSKLKSAGLDCFVRRN